MAAEVPARGEKGNTPSPRHNRSNQHVVVVEGGAAQLWARWRRWWCDAVHARRRRNCSALRELGGCAVGEGGGREIENGRGMARAGAGGVNGSRRPALAAVGRALVTRGRRRGHAARVLCRCRPLTP